MPTDPPKLFSAELQMLGLQSAPGRRPAQPSEPAGAGFGGGAEILDAIKALRTDLNALRAEVAGAPKLPADEENTLLRIEIARMIKSLSRTKREISQIKHPGVDKTQMDEATNELDAIVSATEHATQRILESVETLNAECEVIATAAGDNEDIIPAIYRIHAGLDSIMEACSFQDITGQRITRVVKTLNYVEERVKAIIEEWGIEAFMDLPVPEQMRVHASDDLVHGPAAENEGLSQDDIDALFG